MEKPAMRKKKHDSSTASDCTKGVHPEKHAPLTGAPAPEPVAHLPLGASTACVRVLETSTVVCGIVVEPPAVAPASQVAKPDPSDD
jgi:hypothetical protein